VVVAVAVAAVVGGPTVAANRWLGRHRPEGVVAVWRPRRQAAGRAAAAILGLTVIGGAVLPALGDRAGWMVVIGVPVAWALLAVGQSVAEARSAPELGPPEPGGPSGDHPGATLEALVRRRGSGRVRLGLLEGPAGEAGPNACAIGWGRSQRILVSPSLLEVRPDLRDFVVAHELVHLDRRHQAIQLGTGLVGGLVVLAVARLAAAGGSAALGRPADDPLALPALVGVVAVASGAVRLPSAWVRRGMERQADVGAVDLVGPVDRGGVRALLLASGQDLQPVRPERWWAPHPGPAERAELLRRLRAGRSVTEVTDRPGPAESVEVRAEG
jgi:Zn-dependent protease with chaperone function